jgi:hypothetical protein
VVPVIGTSRDKPPADPSSQKGGLKRDWAENFLADGQVQPNTYPAKWSFSTTTASCSNGFVVYPTGVGGGASAAEIVGYTNLYSGGGRTVESGRLSGSCIFRNLQ